MAHIDKTIKMHYSKTTILSILIILTANFFGQEIEKNYRELFYVSDYHLVLNNDSVEPFYISENPITNREYLTYLCWLADVYRYNPEVLLNAFPKLDKEQIGSLLNKGFSSIQIRTIVESNYFIEHYIFNPKYLDYPVLGLTWGQAMNFLNWLSDRYNESILIERRILEIDYYQCCEVNFNTEAYLARQYEGLVRELVWDEETNQVRGIKWKDRILVPTFRLPSKSELNLIQQEISNSLKKYSPNKFLKYWTKYYLDINKYQLIIRIEDDNFLSFSYNKNVTVRPDYHETFIMKPEITLDHMIENKENSILKILSKMNQNVIEIEDHDSTILKDSLGHMPYVIITENENLNPILIERLDYQNTDSSSMNKKKEYSIFRYALCGIKK